MEKPVYQIVFLRHGESTGNAESRWQGQSNYPLNERGRAQATALAKRWRAEEAKFDLIISSTLARARETAEIIAAALNVPLEYNELWLERDIGEMEGLTPTELQQRPRPAYVTPYESIGGDGEGDWELFLRAGQALHSLLKRPAGSYLIVSHGGLLNQVMHAIVGVAHHADPSGVRFRFENTSFARVLYHPYQHRWAIDALNDHAHIESLK
jgi:broad specificity phosphatase PhoE